MCIRGWKGRRTACKGPAPGAGNEGPSFSRTSLWQAHWRATTHLGDFERHTVLLAQLLQLRQHAVGDHGRALGIQAVHHALRNHKIRFNVRGKQR